MRTWFFGRGGCDNYGMTPAWAISWGGINKLQKRILMMPSTTFIGHQVLLEAPEVLKLPLEVWQRVQILILGLLNGISKSIKAVRKWQVIVAVYICEIVHIRTTWNLTYFSWAILPIHHFIPWKKYRNYFADIEDEEMLHIMPRGPAREGCGDEHQHSLGHNVNPHGKRSRSWAQRVPNMLVYKR